MAVGAPKGNQNAKRGALWREAIRAMSARLEHDLKPRTNLERAAAALWGKAMDGDVSALKELGDRVDGKAVQSIELVAEVDVKTENISAVTKLEEFLASKSGR